jgi:alpha-galactosidase
VRAVGRTLPLPMQRLASCFLTAVVLAFLVTSRAAEAVTPTADEMALSHRWAAGQFEGPAETPSRAGQHPAACKPCFSFNYGGRSSRELLTTWKLTRTRQPLDVQRTQHTLAYADSVSGLVVRCVATEYHDFPVVEWTVYFQNTGDKDTPILEDVQALDVVQALAPSSKLTVHHARGSNAAFTDFSPLTSDVTADKPLRIGTRGRADRRGGNSSVESLPFFNIETGNQGTIVGIGWTGPWVAWFARSPNGSAGVCAGIERLQVLLHPGEEIRSPRVALLFWQGDRLRAQNLWRRFVFAYYSPRPGGKSFTGMIADANWGSWMNADTHIAEINYWADHDLPMECYWVDAGWTDMSLGWEAHQSHQTPNPSLFPRGMRPLADAAHRRGQNFLLWMVPQSANPAVGIGKQHPEWLGKPLSSKEYGNMVFYGLDHGSPRINQHMIDHFSKVVRDFGVDIFREDGGNLWPEDNVPNRLGMAQVKYIQGFYDFWDGLLKNHPDLLIDNCAEGGRKIDLETIRRSIVFWRSDSQASGDFDAVSNQGFNYGLLPWVPLCGAPAPMKKLNAYDFRSAYCPALLICWPMANVANLKDRWAAVDVDRLRKLLREYLAIRPYLFGDFYPLTPYSIEHQNWLAWQYDCPERGGGIVQAFRREKCPETALRVALQGLDPKALYTLRNLDAAGAKDVPGRELLDHGVTITIKDQPGATIVAYKKKS